VLARAFPEVRILGAAVACPLDDAAFTARRHRAVVQADDLIERNYMCRRSLAAVAVNSILGRITIYQPVYCLRSGSQ
jgi:hypothetical protein